MISITVWKQYKAEFPSDHISYTALDDIVRIQHGKESWIEPEGETEDTFLDRIVRSKKTGRNLFCEEWDKEEWDEDWLE